MGMLSRYQKSGGFIQLVQLIETCGKQKQDNFLSIIEKEDPNWAHALKEKILTIEKLFSWDASVLAEIAGRLQQLTIATALHGLKPEEKEKFLSTFSHSQRRNIDDLFDAKSPGASEISSAFIKILQETRNMISQGYIRPEKFAPELLMPENFEELLGKSKQKDIEINISSAGTMTVTPTSSNTTPSSPPTTAPANSGGNDAELNTLRTKVRTLSSENTNLKAELKILRDKISQIRKIA